MRVMRVFPRRTKATPDDELAVCRLPELWDEADKVMVSVAFTWDIQSAERLAVAWGVVAPVEIGGPAMESVPGEFVPGLFLRRGYVITSRGCPCRCPHCMVPRREGTLRVLPIMDGWDVLDNNLLACPRDHVEAVFAMLDRQPRRPKFTGGLESGRLLAWHVDWFLRLRPDALWFAYDSPDDWEPLVSAVGMLRDAGLVGPHKKKRCGAYVLMGWGGDTPHAAMERLRMVIGLGIKTQAMLLDNGRECRPEDMRDWWSLRRAFTDARSVGAMVAKSWEDT